MRSYIGISHITPLAVVLAFLGWGDPRLVSGEPPRVYKGSLGFSLSSKVRGIKKDQDLWREKFQKPKSGRKSLKVNARAVLCACKLRLPLPFPTLPQALLKLQRRNDNNHLRETRTLSKLFFVTIVRNLRCIADGLKKKGYPATSSGAIPFHPHIPSQIQKSCENKIRHFFKQPSLLQLLIPRKRGNQKEGRSLLKRGNPKRGEITFMGDYCPSSCVLRFVM